MKSRHLPYFLLLLIAACILICILFSAGCVQSPQNPGFAAPEPAISNHTEIQPATPGVTQQEYKDMKQTNLENTAKIIDAVQKLTGDENTVISDLSINMALGMVLAGADNTCQKELETFLGTSKENVSALNRDLLDHYKNLRKTNVTLANSFWFDNGFNLQTPYKNTLMKYFDAEVGQYDFKDAGTAKKINNWCAEKTNNRIAEIVTADAVRDLTNILINAVYFNSEWRKPFEESRCAKETFKGFEKETDITMMHAKENIYFENDKATGFQKYYSDGISFIGILPKKEGQFTLEELNLGTLLKSKTYEYDVNIGLPKFKTDCSMSLVDPLKLLGFRNVFSDEANSFDEIGRTVNNKPIKISDILHKTYIDVNERGTEAAAVSAVMMMEVTSMAPVEKITKTVILDRPFAFLIVDETNDQILFAGKITSVKE